MDFLFTVDLIVLGSLLIFSGVFSASETALMGLGRLRLAHAIEKGGRRSRALEVWKKDPNRILTTILILNNAINISATTVAAFLAIHISELFQLNRGQTGTLIAAGVTLIIILFGEVTPKILAIHKSEPIVLAIIQPLVLLGKLLHPVSRLLIKTANLFENFFSAK